MKRITQLLVLAGLVVSLNSCGLPAALGRSAGRAVNGVAGMANSL